ncbi:MAG: aminomethyltransferase beta-barrel domain-containing protein, partial [Phycisphaerales bacterium]
ANHPLPPTPSGRRERFEIRFHTPQHGIAPGQALVVYDHNHPDRVIAGGWIESTQTTANTPSHT